MHEAPPDKGIGLLSVFVIATLVMVAGISLTAILDRWWVLIPVMSINLVTTFIVVWAIARLLDDAGEPLPS